MERTWRLFVPITPLLQSMEGTKHGQVCIVVLGAHLMLSVLAALGICVGYMCLLRCLERTWCCVCVAYMNSGVIGVHLVQEGSGPCKIPISYGVTGHICTCMH